MNREVKVYREVNVNVKSQQVDEFGQVDNQDFFTKGKLFRKSDAFFIFYDESEITGLEGTNTRLKVEPDMVTLTRIGETSQKQVFQEGLKHQGNYVTPYGRFLITVTTSKVESNLTEAGGSIKLEYGLEIDGQKVSMNTLSITVREA